MKGLRGKREGFAYGSREVLARQACYLCAVVGFALLLVLLALECIQVACGDNTGGEGNEGDTEERGAHGDAAPDGGDRVNISITYGC